MNPQDIEATIKILQALVNDARTSYTLQSACYTVAGELGYLMNEESKRFVFGGK